MDFTVSTAFDSDRVIGSDVVDSSTHTKILLVANTGWYLYNFRLPLARMLRDRGVQVVMVSPRDAYVERLESEGFQWIELNLNRRSMNPAREALVLGQLAQIYRRERPTAVHHFTIKCVLYGTMAAKLAGIKSVVNAVTGLGHIFIGTKWKARVLRPAVKWVYRNILTARRVKVVFQNPDDLQAFTDFKLIVPERTVIIKGGSGVNLQRFAPRPGHPEEAPAPIVLFASRLIAEKGLFEFVEAARALKMRGVHATFQIAGSPDAGNPSSLSEETLENWRREGAVDLLGHSETVEELIAQSTMVVLPSYREGTPRILLEAAAMAKPIVATDVPGCREVVEDGVNGLLVPVKDSTALASAIERMLATPDRCLEMGEAGRAKMMQEFDDQDVARRTIEVYELTRVVPAARAVNKSSVA